jgi:hypothetical protein
MPNKHKRAIKWEGAATHIWRALDSKQRFGTNLDRIALVCAGDRTTVLSVESDFAQ